MYKHSIYARILRACTFVFKDQNDILKEKKCLVFTITLISRKIIAINYGRENCFLGAGMINVQAVVLLYLVTTTNCLHLVKRVRNRENSAQRLPNVDVAANRDEWICHTAATVSRSCVLRRTFPPLFARARCSPRQMEYVCKIQPWDVEASGEGN